MRLVWECAAKADRKEIYDYIKRNNPIAAATLSRRLVKEASRLVRYPQLGHVGRLPGTREWVVRNTYILVYKLTEEAVCILRVLHAARRWPQGHPPG